jgi:hypothetical protein
MGKRSLLVAAVVLVGFALWRLALDQRAMPEEELPAEPSAPAALEPQRDPQPAAEATQRPASDTKQQAEPEDPATPAAPSQAPSDPEQAADSTPLPPPQRSGPIAELKHAFETEPRDSAAQVTESRIQNEFIKGDIAPGMLRSVLCRESVCKVEVLWTPQRAESFMAAFTRLSADFQPDIALDPHQAADAPQELQVDVYLPRLGSRAKPTEH